MSFPKIEGYVVTEKLGSGSYSTVYKAYTKVGARSVVAIKCVDKSRVKHSGAAVDNLVTEIRLLKTLRHPHIVSMRDFTWDDKNIYIITEYCAGGDLSRYIRRYGRVPEKQVRFFLQQLASALQFLRQRGVVHMDLKPHNLLLNKGPDGKYTLKVADFGFAQHMSSADVSLGVRGSPLYMAPEMFTGGGYDAGVDLWSVGVIMYESLFGRAPYSSGTFKELMEKINNQTPIEIPENAGISPGCRRLLLSLLQRDPSRRVSYDDFFNDEYLDLEHMPHEQNYDKAVSLITEAVQADAIADYEAALPLYCEALRYLVPRVGVETDARRRALSEKVDSYMRRAEELKAFLRSGVPLPVAPPPPAPHRLTCCAGTNSVEDGPFQRQMSLNQPTNGVSQHTQDAKTIEISDDEEQVGSATNEASTSSPKSKRSSRGADLARRFFRLKSQSVDAALVQKDSSVTEERGREEKTDKMLVGETASDMCKIS